MSENNLVDAVREHALKNYNTAGWDFVVECWSDADISAAFGDAAAEDQAISRVKACVSPLAEYRDDIRAA